MAGRDKDDDDDGWEPMPTTFELRQHGDEHDVPLSKRDDEDKRVDLTRRDDD